MSPKRRPIRRQHYPYPIRCSSETRDMLRDTESFSVGELPLRLFTWVDRQVSNSNLLRRRHQHTERLTQALRIHLSLA